MSLLSRLAVQAARAYGILSSKSTNVSASYLVVAGGGGGGSNYGGGGAGGYLTSTFTLSTLNTYSITVGAGGNGGASGSSNGGANGSNSIISGTGLTTVTSIGGGGGGTVNTGGSGGGGGGVGTPGQGNNGGSSSGTFPFAAGGGGGAGAVGGNGSGSVGGNGGVGLSSSISGSSVFYAGGGGGTIEATGTSGSGGNGGGGAAGASGGNNAGTAGTANTGGGGGGGHYQTAYATGGAGGSGIVIISYASATPKFVGGTLTTSGGNQIHTFTSSGTLSPITPVTASYLVVAGGGGGGTASGGFYAGGGGAGGLLTSSTTLYSGATYVVTVGAGGAINTSGSSSVLLGTGLTTVTSTGGGRGGAFQTNGAAGGSGGGAGGDGSGGTYTGGLGTSGQGNNGGNAAVAFGSTNTGGGGGGGAGAAGSNSPTSTKNGGAGGAGSASSISGTSVTYSAGGGGMAGNDGTGGTEGANGTGWVSAPNLGHGGGPSVQRTGSSGIVIISYAGSQVFNGGLVTSSGGNTIHTFTSSGALTPLTNNLTNSLRFRSSNSNYLNRTFVTPTDNKKWTYSGWVKRGTLGSASQQHFFNYWTGGTGQAGILFSATTDTIEFFDYTGSYGYQLVTTQVFRDPSAWYHFVIAVDTTQATAANRIKMYVNGNQITAFGTSTYPSLNYNTLINSANAHYIGRRGDASGYFDGYQTDINFIDGQALEPYYFGNNDAYGNWKPIKYTGMYGTNGFYLTFADTSALTTSSNAGLGKDTSGNGNYWATNNISITSGTTYDAMLDVPTNTSATVANYPTLNPLSGDGTLSSANLNLSGTDQSRVGTMSFPTTGQWYFEMTMVANAPSTNWDGVGIATLPINTSGTVFYIYRSNATKLQNGGSNVSYGSTFATGDVIGVAYDAGAGTLVFYKNNTSQGTAYTGISGEFFPVVYARGITSAPTLAFNAGQRPFSYTPPTGFVALNTFNLPTPTILQGNNVMDATLYTGTGTTQTVTNAALFKPDLVWLKRRDGANSHYLFDAVRGVGKYLSSDATAAEATLATSLTSFNSNGFSLGTAGGGINVATGTFVGWQWQAGQGTTTTGTGTGGITSVTQSVNTTAGFSIVTYTGSGANGTVTHGLGVAPAMVIVKRRSGAEAWGVYHKSLGATQAINLELTVAAYTYAIAWNNTAPTSSTFSLGTWAAVNSSGGTFVAYCWAEIAGFSKFGSYTGNGSADGPFVFTNFRPKYIMIKRTDTTANWIVMDTGRGLYNASYYYLLPNLTDADSGPIAVDFLSNGFKMRLSNAPFNASGGTYIYMAFAENPFKNANAR
jgi:hypothetical protein